ncbi:MAG: hypothetical protein ACOX1X_09320 [Dethiobacteria bacterium]
MTGDRPLSPLIKRRAIPTTGTGLVVGLAVPAAGTGLVVGLLGLLR